MTIGANAEITPNAVYTLQEVCHFLRISEATARRWIKTGRLPGRKIGRDYRFLGSDLLESLESGLTRHTGLDPVHPFGPDHPLLLLAGVGESGRPDIAEEHDRYLTSLLRNRG